MVTNFLVTTVAHSNGNTQLNDWRQNDSNEWMNK